MLLSPSIRGVAEGKGVGSLIRYQLNLSFSSQDRHTFTFLPHPFLRSQVGAVAAYNFNPPQTSLEKDSRPLGAPRLPAYAFCLCACCLFVPSILAVRIGRDSAAAHTIQEDVEVVAIDVVVAVQLGVLAVWVRLVNPGAAQTNLKVTKV